ncbi:deoxyribodipyrimidine photolyase [Opitutaceae bacterium EW11]|nr:deoxyribodipyrimidine photolyase [Opitutaceae bacterium EW11]
MPRSTSILWFRQDLRLSDNPALQAAVRRGGAVVPVFIWDEEGEGRWVPGGASRWWLHHSLQALAERLRGVGSRLILRRGRSEDVLRDLLRETAGSAVYWNRRYEPAAIERDARIEAALRSDRVEAESANGALLFEPSAIKNRQGGPFQVFTPFWRTCLAKGVEAPAVCVERLPGPAVWPKTLRVEELPLLPAIRWDAGLAERWQPGELAAAKRLDAFLRGAVGRYAEKRDFPALNLSSELSPHLHFGELGPRQVWAGVQRLSEDTGVFPVHAGAQKFLSELGWREFAYHLLLHFPTTAERPLRAEFERFPWAEDPQDRSLRVWQQGRTGYPIVDAGMRQLWATGWMPNRVRMIAGSFLVKHLRLPWQRGAEWFWDTLVDADLASNTLGWQWVAGCGADAAPYFRIFAPVLQSRKFDPDGAYLRRWLPELASLPDAWIHAPWEAPADVCTAAGVTLGRTYPYPIVDHAKARETALAAYRSLRS